MTDQADRTFTSEQGLVIRLRSVPQRLLLFATERVEAEMRAEGSPIDPPVFEVSALGGAKERLPLTEALLEKGTEDPEEQRRWQAAWAQHQAALEELETRQEDASQRVMYGLGTMFELPEGREWLDDIAYVRGEAIETEDPRELRALYLMLAPGVLSEADRGALYMELAAMMAGIDQENVATFRAGTKRQMARAARQAFDEFAAESGQLGGDDGPPGSHSDEGMATGPGAVGRPQPE